MQIKIIEGRNTLGWSEIGFYGVEDLEFLNQLMWRAGEHISLVYTGGYYIFFSPPANGNKARKVTSNSDL